MADCYTLMSTIIVAENQEQLDWLYKAFEIVQGYADEEVPLEDIPDEVVAEFTDYGVDMDGYIVMPDYSALHETDKKEGTETFEFWIHSDENFDVENTAVLLKAYLTKFNIKKAIICEYAFTCSKPRAGEFGGGAFVVTKDEIKFWHTGAWAYETAKELVGK